jgi:hypothetical protein
VFGNKHSITEGRTKMREKILIDHLKERTNDLNQLEEEFGQEEKGLE